MKRAQHSWPRLLCEPDNVTPCPVRIIVALAIVIYHCGIIYAVGMDHAVVTFDSLRGYLKDMAILTGVTGPALGAKSLMYGDAPHDEDNNK